MLALADGPVVKLRAWLTQTTQFLLARQSVQNHLMIALTPPPPSSLQGR